RGEVTLVVAGAPPVAADMAEAVRAVHELTASGTRLRPAVAEVALRLGIAKNRLYEQVLRDQGE
ncbi:MAG TPA: 16S rRNA (cytidine(1402)-2'-O)-methyltransferase, partial [Propionibacteriaceae bacterium]|nr:16S rRNA (cytidine(1402)-2'-O)-methyltransferase [Propionibacteriaceae bacterium]